MQTARMNKLRGMFGFFLDLATEDSTSDLTRAVSTFWACCRTVASAGHTLIHHRLCHVARQCSGLRTHSASSDHPFSERAEFVTYRRCVCRAAETRRAGYEALRSIASRARWCCSQSIASTPARVWKFSRVVLQASFGAVPSCTSQLCSYVPKEAHSERCAQDLGATCMSGCAARLPKLYFSGKSRSWCVHSAVDLVWFLSHRASEGLPAGTHHRRAR